MKINIITPTYNRAESLERTIESIQKNKHKNTHIYVVIDGNEKIFQNYSAPSVTVLRNEERMDWVFSINRVLREMDDADAVIYASDDVEFPHDAITRAVIALREYFPNGDGLIGLKQSCPGIKSAFGLMGRKFIQRFPDNQVFCPDYIHFGSDEELGRFAKSVNKFHFCESIIIRHDRAIDETRKLGLKVLDLDVAMKEKRKENGFLWGKNFGRVRK